MALTDHLARVHAAEQAVEACRADTLAHCRRTVGLWRAGWTPGRIVIAGLALGFLGGRGKPLRLSGSGGLLSLLRSLAQLVESSGLGGGAPSVESTPPETSTPPAPEPAIWPEAPRRKAPPFVTTS